MNPSLIFVRLFFLILSIFFMTTYTLSRPTGLPLVNTLIGIGSGALFTMLLIGFDRAFRKFNLRTFNMMIIGLFIGYLMGQGLVLIFNTILSLGSISQFLSSQIVELLKLSLFLFGTYLGSIMTLRASDQLYISIPFVKFAPTTEKKRDLLIAPSTLRDTRFIDLCSTGILNHHLIIPRFIMKELYTQSEIGSDAAMKTAHQTLEVIKKMEALPNLGLRFNETDFPEIKDIQSKLMRLARLLDAHLLISDSNQVHRESTKEIQLINLHSLSNVLKPLMQMGENIQIKVQRYGKEPRQGVGYLEDGTMVVINGGGNYIGETINAQVLSVKHTSSGRMIFCNAIEDHEKEHSRQENQGSYGNQYVYYEHEGE